MGNAPASASSILSTTPSWLATGLQSKVFIWVDIPSKRFNTNTQQRTHKLVYELASRACPWCNRLVEFRQVCDTKTHTELPSHEARAHSAGALVFLSWLSPLQLGCHSNGKGITANVIVTTL